MREGEREEGREGGRERERESKSRSQTHTPLPAPALTIPAHKGGELSVRRRPRGIRSI